MAFVPGYKHDIFVSYAIADNQRRWVTELVNSLTKQLGAELGRRGVCRIWFDDTDLDEAGRVTDEIDAAIEESAVLILVLSKAYAASQWCQRERQTFLDAIAHRVSAESRIFVVDTGNLPREEWPAELREIKGFEF